MLQPTEYSWHGATVYRHPDYKDTLFIVYQRPPTTLDAGTPDEQVIHFTPHVLGIWCPEGYWKTQAWRGDAYGCTPRIDPPTDAVRLRNFAVVHEPADLLTGTGC